MLIFCFLSFVQVKTPNMHIKMVANCTCLKEHHTRIPVLVNHQISYTAMRTQTIKMLLAVPADFGSQCASMADTEGLVDTAYH
jgi:hypothetical protein